MGADEKREAISRGYTPSRRYGGIDLTTAEWRLLGGLVLVASCVRLFRISQPDSVV